MGFTYPIAKARGFTLLLGKDFPFGKKKFGNIIKENHTKSMEKLQNIFMQKMMEYENAIPNNDRNDDMTIIAFEIDKQSN